MMAHEKDCKSCIHNSCPCMLKQVVRLDENRKPITTCEYYYEVRDFVVDYCIENNLSIYEDDSKKGRIRYFE